MDLLQPISKTFDCGHGRELRINLPMGLDGLAFVHLVDPHRTHALLSWRDKPSMALICDGTLVTDAMAVVNGRMSPECFGQCLAGRHPQVANSEWRRSLVRQWCAAAVPLDAEKLARQAMGCE